MENEHRLGQETLKGIKKPQKLCTVKEDLNYSRARRIRNIWELRGKRIRFNIAKHF
jgi:hypothetical protein